MLSFARYSNPKSGVPFKYLMIVFTAIQCICVGFDAKRATFPSAYAISDKADKADFEQLIDITLDLSCYSHLSILFQSSQVFPLVLNYPFRNSLKLF